MKAPARPVAAEDSDHPKHLLYERVYEPLTVAWFAELERARPHDIARILDRAAPDSLLATLDDLNEVFHTLVDRAMAGLDRRVVNEMVAIVQEHHERVLWMGHAVPMDHRPATIQDSLAAKLKRNISLGVVEATICLESACRYAARRTPDLRGAGLEQLLRRSRALYASLAMLHDNQEQERLRILAGIEGALKYPETTYSHVLNGDVTIAPEYFVEYGKPERRRLKFRTVSVRSTELDGPIKQCPAQRLRVAGPGSPPLNDGLWDLLVTVYRRCGRLD